MGMVVGNRIRIVGTTALLFLVLPVDQRLPFMISTFPPLFFYHILMISMAELGMVDDKSRKSDFQTDADISASKGPKERDLQRWVPDGPDPAIASSGSKRGGDSETFGTNSAGGWDQFETNKRLFGGDSTYDENIYTTKLDRSAPDFEVRKREAERLANEIQNVRSP
jgi:PAB1-binding protein PBP1